LYLTQPRTAISTFQSHLTTIPCYRMFPQDRLGAGAFTVLFKNTAEGNFNKARLDEIIPV
jgi:hypothetical protein